MVLLLPRCVCIGQIIHVLEYTTTLLRDAQTLRQNVNQKRGQMVMVCMKQKGRGQLTIKYDLLLDIITCWAAVWHLQSNRNLNKESKS